MFTRARASRAHLLGTNGCRHSPGQVTSTHSAQACTQCTDFQSTRTTPSATLKKPCKAGSRTRTHLGRRTLRHRRRCVCPFAPTQGFDHYVRYSLTAPRCESCQTSQRAQPHAAPPRWPRSHDRSVHSSPRLIARWRMCGSIEQRSAPTREALRREPGDVTKHCRSRASLGP